MRMTTKKIVENPVVNRIIDTLVSRNITQKDLIAYLDLPNGTFTSWKYDGGTSYMKYIDSIAEYLHVPKNYLLYGELTTDNTGLLMSDVEDYNLFRQLTDDQKAIIKQTIKAFWNANNHL